MKPQGSLTHIEMAIHNGRIYEPTNIPVKTLAIVDTIPDAGDIGVVGGIPGPSGSTGGGGGSQLMTDILNVPTPPPRVVETPRTTPRAEVAAATRIVRVSELHLARLIHRVEPVYPQLARQARVQGIVQVEAIIAVDGHMRDLRAVSGHPLLIPAAIAAVRQWIYEPTVLNGEKVEVSAPITVNFRLGN